MNDYVYWGDPIKTQTLAVEMAKCAGCAFGACCLFSFQTLFLIAFWVAVLHRSKFLYILVSAFRQARRDFSLKRFGKESILALPLESLFDLLKKEKNLFAQYLFNPYGTTKIGDEMSMSI